jgi:hypothetical protein
MLTEVTKLPFTIFQPETALEAMQRGISCYSNAWTQLARSLMSATAAEIELVRTMYTASDAESETGKAQAGSGDAIRDWLQASQSKHDAALKRQRQISDDLTASFFIAAKGIVEAYGRTEETTSQAVTQSPPARSATPRQQAVA